MQVSATGNAPVTFRPPASEIARRPEIDLGQEASQNRGAAQQAADGRTVAEQVRADEVRVTQAETAEAVEALNRANVPEEATDAVSEGGGEGRLRGGRLDISV
ncbi:MAG: hypothetical protein R3C97_07290 [Geminicoccaceae bacterium]